MNAKKIQLENEMNNITICSEVSLRHYKRIKNKILQDDEKAIAMVSGTINKYTAKLKKVIEDIFYINVDKSFLFIRIFFKDYLIVTDKRVLFWSRNFFISFTKSFDFSTIISIGQHQDSKFGEIFMNVCNKRIFFYRIKKENTIIIRNLIKDKKNLAKWKNF